MGQQDASGRRTWDRLEAMEQLVKLHSVELVRFETPDLNGVSREKSIAADYFRHYATEGLALVSDIGGGDVDPARFGATAAGSDVDPERDALEADLVTHCRDQRIPVLGICWGAQMLNVPLGGTPTNVEGHVQDQPLHDPVDRVDVVAGCRLSTLLGDAPIGANSFHRWAIQDPADGVRVVAHATDGAVEGIEWTGGDWFAVGAPWHAELLDEAHAAGLFEGFMAAARTRRAP